MKKMLMALVVAWFLAAPSFATDCPALKDWYLQYDDEYFDGMLPRTVIIQEREFSSDESGVMAKTTKEGVSFTITYNTRFRQGAQFEHLILLHESCHILSWSEKKMHGHQWVDCMRRIEKLGAFDNLLIGGYE